jgi:hypothetical protein
MSYDESRALLGEPERPRRPMPILAIVLGAACFAGVGVAAGVVFAAKRAESEAVGARVAAETKAAEDARFAAARIAELESTTSALETRVADESVGRARAEVAATRASSAAAILRAIVKASTDGVPGAPPRRALHEVLRGEVLATLRESMSREEGLDVALSIVRSMALDPRIANVAMARTDLAFVKEFLAEALSAYPAESDARAEALLAVAQMCVAYADVPALDGTSRVIFRENATTCVDEVIRARQAGGGRAFAIALELRGRLARAAGDPAKATADFEAARAALGDTPDTFDSARIAVGLAVLWADTGRASDAVQLLRVEANAAERAFPLGSVAELELRRTLAGILARKSDDPNAPSAALEERVHIGRLLVQLYRPQAGRETLVEALERYAADETRFRERLETAVWLARALDMMGATGVALATIDQPRIREDARILGEKTVISRDHAALIEELRAKSAARSSAGKPVVNPSGN